MRKIILLFVVMFLLSGCKETKLDNKAVEQEQDTVIIQENDKITGNQEAETGILEQGGEIVVSKITESEELTATTEETLIEPGFITGANIICLGNMVEDIDIDTFQLLKYDYAKDKDSLYYCGDLGFLVFSDIDVNTVEIIDTDILKDKNFQYKLGMNGILEKEKKTIQERVNLGNGFSKDLDFVYYKNRKIDGLNPKNFQMLGYKYIKDSQNIYFMQDGFYKKLGNIDIDTFEVLKKNEGCMGTNDYICYAKDKNNIISNGIILTGSDTTTFQIIDKFFAKDKNAVYYKASKLDNLDGDTFQLLGKDYIKDKNGIYLLNPANTKKEYIQINEIDIDTFRILDNHYDDNIYAMDQYNIYFYIPYKDNNIIINYFATIPKTIDSDTIKVLGDGYVEDLHYLYYFHLSKKEKKIYSYKLDIDLNSVKFIDSIFLKDKNYVYMKNKDTGEHIKLDFVDRNSFNFLNPSYAMDNNNIYYYSKINNEVSLVDGADWESFEVIEDNKGCDDSIDSYCFAMDDFNIYKYGNFYSSNDE